MANLSSSTNIFGDRYPQPSFPVALAKEGRVYDFVQWIDQGSLTASGPYATSTSIPTAFATYFTLSQLAQSATFTALFDQYRIAMIEMLFSPQANAINTPSSSNGGGELYSYVDFDDATAPTVAIAQQRSNSQVVAGYQSVVHRFIPHVAQAAYSGTFASFANVTAPWIDCTSTTVQHYGVKAAAPVSNVIIKWDIFTRVHIQFRNVV